MESNCEYAFKDPGRVYGRERALAEFVERMGAEFLGENPLQTQSTMDRTDNLYVDGTREITYALGDSSLSFVVSEADPVRGVSEKPRITALIVRAQGMRGFVDEVSRVCTWERDTLERKFTERVLRDHQLAGIMPNG